MASTAILRPHRHHHHRLLLLTSHIRFTSSSSSNNNNNNNIQNPNSQSSSFSDVKSSLKHTPPSPQRTPSFHNPNPNTPSKKIPSLEDIRKNLSTFRREPSSQPPHSTSRVPSFQELYQKNVASKSDSPSETRGFNSLEAIRSSLKNIRTNANNINNNNNNKGAIRMDDIGLNLKLRPKSLSEMNVINNNNNNNNKKGEVSDETEAEFVRTYTHGEMGERLRKLRSGNKKVGFSLEELNQRLRMVREMEVKELAMNPTFGILRDGLIKLKDDGTVKKNAAPKISVLPAIEETSNFFSHPPKEVLVEKYFHPDHMSSAEKQKLELKNVREKFKISESDCGSARVQVAQLTTKIKHLATVLHKKDKHSRKGLQAMVQKRKKLLKYLRRTDWDSYCFCLSELGLRDSADYKA